MFSKPTSLQPWRNLEEFLHIHLAAGEIHLPTALADVLAVAIASPDCDSRNTGLCFGLYRYLMEAARNSALPQPTPTVAAPAAPEATPTPPAEKYLTIQQYAVEFHKNKLYAGQASGLAIRASRIAKNRGIELIPALRKQGSGHCYSYPVSLLEEIFEQYYGLRKTAA